MHCGSFYSNLFVTAPFGATPISVSDFCHTLSSGTVKELQIIFFFRWKLSQQHRRNRGWRVFVHFSLTKHAPFPLTNHAPMPWPIVFTSPLPTTLKSLDQSRSLSLGQSRSFPLDQPCSFSSDQSCSLPLDQPRSCIQGLIYSKSVNSSPWPTTVMIQGLIDSKLVNSSSAS